MIITCLLYENAEVGQPHPLHDPLQRGKDAPVLGVQAPVQCTYYLIFSKCKYTCMLTNLHSTSPFFFRKRRVRKRTCLTSHEQKSQQGLKLAVSKLAVILDSAKSMSALQYCIKDSTDIVWHKIVCGFSER